MQNSRYVVFPLYVPLILEMLSERSLACSFLKLINLYFIQQRRFVIVLFLFCSEFTS